MVYKYEKGIINYSNVNAFFNRNNFVGYILPDGSIYQCRNHNISNIDTVLKLYLTVLKTNYNDKDILFDIEVNDKILILITNYLKKASLDQIIALSNFMDKENVFISDLLVELFGCHLISRIQKTIITSEPNHQVFFNYLLNDVKIYTIDKIMYDKEKKEYKYISAKNRNDYLYDEVENLKKEVKEDEIELFYK